MCHQCVSAVAALASVSETRALRLRPTTTNSSRLCEPTTEPTTMMASLMSYFTGRRDPKQSARDAIVSLREQLITIEKKEEHLQRQIGQDLVTAKANAVSNKAGTFFPPVLRNCGLQHTLVLVSVATAALRRKKMHEADLEKLAGMRLQLEVQVNTLESANINANTLEVMRKGANALKGIHDGLYVSPPHHHLHHII
jgi:charged multivesicular body protein 4